MKDNAQKRFAAWLTILRFLPYKITDNLYLMFADFKDEEEIILTAYYHNEPSEIELELLDDIATNSKAHLPDNFTTKVVKMKDGYMEGEKHDFVVFAKYRVGSYLRVADGNDARQKMM